MGKLVSCLVLNLLFLWKFVLPQATYQCGIRDPLIGWGRKVEEGLWPWHVAVFRKLERDDQFKYGCGGTLVNEKHVLTAAHCVVHRQSRNSLPAVLYEIKVHLGQYNLSDVSDSIVIRDISKAHVHPEYAKYRNNIAVLVMRLPVEYSDTVIPICLNLKVGRDLRELEGLHGWITGWRLMKNGLVSEVLQMISLPVVSHLQCLRGDLFLLGHVLDENVFCAGNRNGTNPGPGDGGGGMYISDGDRWMLIGIVSHGESPSSKQIIKYSTYTVFVNVQQYLSWIENIFIESGEPRMD